MKLAKFKFHKIEWAFHVIFWLIYYFIFYTALIIGFPKDKVSYMFLEEIAYTSSELYVVYSILFIIIPLLSSSKIKKPIAILLSVSSIFIFALFRYLFIIFGSNTNFDIIYEVTSSILIYIRFGAIVIAYWAGKSRIIIEKEKDKIEKEKLQLEKSKLQTELAHLKSQFSPHLLYNTLNFFYGRVYKLDEALADNLAKLSDILRYSLEGEPDSLIDLDEEVKYLQNFIDLHKLRFGDNFFINLSISGNLTGKKILPLVLISFIENAIKHGEYTSAEHPIEVVLRVANNEILFSVRNLKKINRLANIRFISTGLGLENIRKRIKLIYGNLQELTISEDDSFYTTILKIEIPEIDFTSVSDFSLPLIKLA